MSDSLRGRIQPLGLQNVGSIERRLFGFYYSKAFSYLRDWQVALYFELLTLCYYLYPKDHHGVRNLINL